jgi:replicative DNA helicase
MLPASVPTIYFSLEQSIEQVESRLSRYITGTEREQAPLHIEDGSSVTVDEMYSKCVQFNSAEKQKLGLVIIDYLQLINQTGKPVEMNSDKSAEVIRAVKKLANDLGVPVILLSQVSRACEQRNDHRPILSDFGKSGTAVEAADIIAFLYRDGYYNPESCDNPAELIIAKHPAGVTGTVNLHFHKETLRFTDLK